MKHIAIDLGGRESQVCVREADGTIVEERRCRTLDLGEYLSRQERGRVILETCAEAFRVADLARASGHEVRVVAATLVRSLGVGARRTKTDRRDAQTLSEVSTRIDLPSVHVASSESRARKTMCGMREALVQSRTKLVNTVRGWLRGQAYRIRPGSLATFCARVRKAGGSELPSYVERQLKTLDLLNEQIVEADTELLRQAKNDSTCRRLMTVPGVGPVVATRFVAALDTSSRFVSAHKVEAFLGLTPGENSSSDRQRRTGITKAGSTHVRWVLTQAAHAALRSKGVHPMLDWAREVEKRRGKRIAIIALARKIAGILFAIWRDGTFYDPLHITPRPEPTVGTTPLFCPMPGFTVASLPAA